MVTHSTFSISRWFVHIQRVGSIKKREKRPNPVVYYFAHKAQKVKNLPAIQETWVCSLGQEEPLEKGMATHSSILAWRIPWTEEPGGL